MTFGLKNLEFNNPWIQRFLDLITLVFSHNRFNNCEFKNPFAALSATFLKMSIPLSHLMLGSFAF